MRVHTLAKAIVATGISFPTGCAAKFSTRQRTPMKPCSLFDRDQKRPFPGSTFLELLTLICVAMVALYGSASLADTRIPLFPSASNETRQGFVRVVNHSDQEGVVSIVATDDAGDRYPPVSLFIAGGETVHFNSGDLERGNASKGLTGSTGPGAGNWRLTLSTDLNIKALAYIRTSDGFLTSMYDLAPVSEGNRHRIAIFNPGSNRSQVSSLRLINPGDAPAAVVITGTDDRGRSPGSAVRLTLGAGVSRTLSAQTLESGSGVRGALGDGQGKWSLAVEADRPIHAMSLLSSPTGHLTNLSSIPPGRNTFVPLFPAAGRSVKGFVRVVNHSEEAGEVRIVATDDVGKRYPPVLLPIAASGDGSLQLRRPGTWQRLEGAHRRHRCQYRRLALAARKRPGDRSTGICSHRGRDAGLDARSRACLRRVPPHCDLQSGQQHEPVELLAPDQSRRCTRCGRHHRH